MIFDSIKNKKNYTDNTLLYQALEYLSSLTPDTLPAPDTVLIPDILFCNPVTLTSKPENDCIYEAHKRYIDVHYIVEGIEGIATASVDTLKVTTPYSPEKDIEFLEGEKDGKYYLKPGQFMVCFPEDAHKVAIMNGQPAPIKKVVFKIKSEEK